MLIPSEEKRYVDPASGEPGYFRGWFDCVRTDGVAVTLRVSRGKQITFNGRIVHQIVGRIRFPFKAYPRYYDLFLYEKDSGGYVVHRRWVSEAPGEEPCIYDVVEGDGFVSLQDALMNFEPDAYAVGLWPDDMPGGQRRSKKVREAIKESYAKRVRALLGGVM